jgi:hypothetical protein
MSRLTEAQKALEMLVAEAGGQPPTAAELNAHRDAPRVVEAALKRMAQLEYVAELARAVIDDPDQGAADHARLLLDLALTDLDNHPDTREPTTITEL